MAGINSMNRFDQDGHGPRRKLATVNAKLARHERMTGVVLFLLTIVAVLTLGLVIGHIAGAPLLSH